MILSNEMIHIKKWNLIKIMWNVVIFNYNQVCGIDCPASYVCADSSNFYVWTRRFTNMNEAENMCANLGLLMLKVVNIDFLNRELMQSNFTDVIQGNSVWLGAKRDSALKNYRWLDTNEVFDFNLTGRLVGDCLIIKDNMTRIESADCGSRNNIVCMATKSSWFGSNLQFMCHCRSGECSMTGTCLSDCALGWFGEDCQLRDALLNVTHKLLDFSHVTCEQRKDQVALAVSPPTYFSWIRIVAKDKVDKDTFSVALTTSERTILCPEAKSFFIAYDTVDITCCTNLELVSELVVRWQGTRTLCSVHMYKGQNVALHGRSTITSTIVQAASYIVDGQRGILPSSTSSRGVHRINSWDLELSIERVVFEVIIYLKHPAPASAVNIILEFISSSESTIPRKDADISNFRAGMYTLRLLSGTKEKVKKVKLYFYAMTDTSDSILDLSEIEIYGACSPQSYSLYCNVSCIPETETDLCYHDGNCNIIPPSTTTTLETQSTTTTITSLATSSTTTMTSIKTTSTTKMTSSKTMSSTTTQSTTTMSSTTTQSTTTMSSTTTQSTTRTTSLATPSKTTLSSPKTQSRTTTTPVASTTTTSVRTQFTTTMTSAAKTSTAKKTTEVTTKRVPTTRPIRTKPVQPLHCPLGFFGKKCQFVCKCKNNLCRRNGECQPGTGCKEGWFALSCQYSDLAQESNSSDPKLTDNNDSTCYISPQNLISANLTEPFVYTWVRVVFIGYDSEVCEDLRVLSDQTNQFDIFCSNEIVATYVEITWQGNGSVCSLYINGGRNVAIESYISTFKGETTFENNPLKDGITNATACLHFPSDENKKLTFRFKDPQTVTRIIVYTASIKVKDSFILQGSFENDGTRFRYKSLHGFRHVVYLSNRKMSTVSNVTFQVMEGSINVCEIEIYGDCAPPHYYLGCVETCILTCYKHLCHYNGFCYTCRHGRHGTHCMEASRDETDIWIEQGEVPKGRPKKKPQHQPNYNIFLYLCIPIIGLACFTYNVLDLYLREEHVDHEKDSISKLSKITSGRFSFFSVQFDEEAEAEDWDRHSNISFEV